LGAEDPSHHHGHVFNFLAGIADLPGNFGTCSNKYSIESVKILDSEGNSQELSNPWTLQQHLFFFLRNLCYFTPSKLYSGLPAGLIQNIEQGGRISVIIRQIREELQLKSLAESDLTR
jgi:hypothetical protein